MLKMFHSPVTAMPLNTKNHSVSSLPKPNMQYSILDHSSEALGRSVAYRAH